MERREWIRGAASLGLLAAAIDSAIAQGAPAAAGHDHSHHDHGGAQHKALMDSAADCVKTGEICLAHCHETFAAGDTSLAKCAVSVNELAAVCRGLQTLAAQNSPFLPAFAKLTIDVCNACEKECRRHEKKHVQCKECADACIACTKECKKIAA